MKRKTKDQDKPKRTPTFLLELPLQVNSQQAKHLHAHFAAGRQLSNAVLGETIKRLKRMRASEAWQQARAIPRATKQARKVAFTTLRQEYGWSRICRA